MSTFLQDNKYARVYMMLIEKRKSFPAVSGEKHHWVPKSITKNNDVVLLTCREHYIAHLLLIKAVLPEFKKPMVYAMLSMRMRVLKNINMNSRLFEKMRSEAFKQHSVFMKENNPFKSPATRKKASVSKMGENNYMYGKQHSQESINKMKEKAVGRSQGSKNPMYGKHRMGEASPNYGKMFITNGQARKMIPKDQSIPEGWWRGY